MNKDIHRLSWHRNYTCRGECLFVQNNWLQLAEKKLVVCSAANILYKKKKKEKETNLR